MTKSTINDDRKNSENDNVEEVVEKIVTDVYESLAPEPEHRRIIGQTLQLLSNGSPVTLAEIASQLQASAEKVTSTLRKFGAEFDTEGNIIGLGLTLIKTLHVYKVNSRKMYTWCAVDALAFPVILQQTAHIESSDPVTGDKVQIHITPGRVEKIEPKSAVMSFIKNIDVTNVRGTFCNNVNFFSSPETAAIWIAEHSEITFYPVNDVYQALQHIHSNKYREFLPQSKEEGIRTCC
ncbi:MAG: organomercurial lyase [Nitrososphaeraceae archaeon]